MTIPVREDLTLTDEGSIPVESGSILAGAGSIPTREDSISGGAGSILAGEDSIPTPQSARVTGAGSILARERALPADEGSVPESPAQTTARQSRHRSGARPSAHPEGIATFSPRLRGTSYLGSPVNKSSTATRLWPLRLRPARDVGRNPVGVMIFRGRFPKVARAAQPLGWRPMPLWGRRG